VRTFVVSRLIQLVFTLVGMSLLIFLIVRLLPGNYVTSMTGESVVSAQAEAEALRVSGLADPLPVQYVRFLGGLLTGNLGNSLVTHVSVASILAAALPITTELALLAVIVSMVVSVPLGVLSALRPNTWIDAGARIGGLIGLSLPSFWLGILGLLFTSVFLGWTPPVIWIPPWTDPVGNLIQIALPVIAVSLGLVAIVMRMTRGSVLDVLGEDYVRTARAKGLQSRPLITRHVLRNALIPVVTVIGTQIGGLMGGVAIVEVIFGLPGVGNTLLQAVYLRDYPVIEVAAVYMAAMFVLVNLGVDLLYGIIDPRIQGGVRGIT
jgi:peptide/nickel transport system permease protein